MKKLLISMPTCFRVDLVEEFLRTQMDLYNKYNIDICIYDSNEDDRCEEIVTEYKRKYNNLYYIRLAHNIHSNTKVFKIYQLYGIKDDYEYVWMMQDAFRITEKELYSILNVLEKDYDIITLGCDDNNYIGNREYFDVREYFRDSTWRITGYGTCIVKTDTMIRNVDWDYLSNKYLQDDCINYSHIGYYFEQLLKISNPQMYFKHIEDDQYYWSELKKNSAWIQDTFEMLCEIWPCLINKLPSIYNIYKEEVIKSLPVNAVLLTYRNFVTLKKQNIYNNNIYKRYQGKWHLFSEIDENFLEELSLATTDSEIELCEIKRMV